MIEAQKYRALHPSELTYIEQFMVIQGRLCPWKRPGWLKQLLMRIRRTWL